MKITNFELADDEIETVRQMASKKGHAPDTLTLQNIIRAALGLPLRQRGGKRAGAGAPKKKPSRKRPK